MHFVLVHGAWHGAWCWRRLEVSLRAAGADVTSIDLPGHGEDSSPREGVDLEAYAERIAWLIQELDRPVELVGHSMGGGVISRTAELVPQRLAGLVYLCAFLPRDGDSMGALGAEDPDTALGSAIRQGEEPDTLVLDRDAARAVLYHDCPEAEVEAALDRLVPQPVQPLRDPVHITERMWGSVPRAYILCTEDRAISPAMQHLMLERVPCDPVVEMACGHSPFLSEPDHLADTLVGIAAARAPG
ncbi:MAG: alpha/beta fold hydrolase [Gammaproteobacteria bacterium]|nr:alpha/beta fold hydrolase [Gammaproteobacteria bacterium]